MNTILATSDEPSGWTDEHSSLVDALRKAGLVRKDPVAGVMVVTAALEDVDGEPLAVVQTRHATIESP